MEVDSGIGVPPVEISPTHHFGEGWCTPGNRLRIIKISGDGTGTFEIESIATVYKMGAWTSVFATAKVLVCQLDPRGISIGTLNGSWPTSRHVSTSQTTISLSASQDAYAYYANLDSDFGTKEFKYHPASPVAALRTFGPAFTDYAEWHLGGPFRNQEDYVVWVENPEEPGGGHYDSGVEPAYIALESFELAASVANALQGDEYTWSGNELDVEGTYSGTPPLLEIVTQSDFYAPPYTREYYREQNIGGGIVTRSGSLPVVTQMLGDTFEVQATWNYSADNARSSSYRQITIHSDKEDTGEASEWYYDYRVSSGWQETDLLSYEMTASEVPPMEGFAPPGCLLAEFGGVSGGYLAFQSFSMITQISLAVAGALTANPLPTVLLAGASSGAGPLLQAIAPDKGPARTFARSEALAPYTDAISVMYHGSADYTNPTALASLKSYVAQHGHEYYWKVKQRRRDVFRAMAIDKFGPSGYLDRTVSFDRRPAPWNLSFLAFIFSPYEIGG